ncbi:MAG: hypothetical protein EZS28_004158 [Streblomastix strix]|uniref:Uncharacterized protein n=1 Tax=Streblomastix strix TaxID=222440 RepID=A0A5J4X0I6_9EUKA|nr:MAG: hypothetical protein EZS28_004158 [Streblomastix strix]
MIQIPKLLRSLSALSLYKISTHIDLGVDRQSLEVRSWSRTCLIYIQYYGDEQAQQELVNNGYGRVIFISYSTAGGIDEVQDAEIWNGLKQISRFLSELHFGRYNHKPFFQPLPLLARMSVEQIEEEGANEEVEAQMNNVGYYDDSNIKDYANYVKAMVLNHFVHSR